VESQIIDRIEMNPRVCAGKPVVRGTRIPVAMILEQMAAGENREAILESYPELTRDDISAVLLYAKATIERTEIIPSVAV